MNGRTNQPTKERTDDRNSDRTIEIKQKEFS